MACLTSCRLSQTRGPAGTLVPTKKVPSKLLLLPLTLPLSLPLPLSLTLPLSLSLTLPLSLSLTSSALLPPSLPQPTELDLTEPDGLAFGLEGDVTGAELEVRAGVQEIGRG